MMHSENKMMFYKHFQTLKKHFQVGISRAIILINIYRRIDIIQPLYREIRTSSSKLAIIKI